MNTLQRMCIPNSITEGLSRDRCKVRVKGRSPAVVDVSLKVATTDMGSISYASSGLLASLEGIAVSVWAIGLCLFL